jgi:hypothetical protein
LLACFILAPAAAQALRVPVPPAPGCECCELPWSDITKFGADPTDNNSDQRAFELALQDAGAGGTVYVPATKAGQAFLVDSIELARGQRLLGAGRLSSIIRAYRPGTGAGVRRRAADDVAIRIKVMGLTLWDFEYGIDARGVYESHFEDLILDGNTINLFIANVPNRPPSDPSGSMLNSFERIKLSGARVRDLHMTCTDGGAPVNSNAFRMCQFETSHSQPQLSGCGGNGLVAHVFIGNEFRSGVSLSGVTSITFQGNYFEGGDKQLELMGGVLGASIIGNYFHNWATAAVWMGCNGVRGIEVSGNSFWADPIDPDPGIAVVDTGGCSCGSIRILANAFQGVMTPLLVHPAVQACVKEL